MVGKNKLVVNDEGQKLLDARAISFERAIGERGLDVWVKSPRTRLPLQLRCRPEQSLARSPPPA